MTPRTSGARASRERCSGERSVSRYRLSTADRASQRLHQRLLECLPQAFEGVRILHAAALAIVPGLGHFYLGHNMKGFAYLLGIGGLQFFGFDLDLTVIGAAVGGSDAERKGQAIAIWMPSDTARVRETCGK